MPKIDKKKELDTLLFEVANRLSELRAALRMEERLERLILAIANAPSQMVKESTIDVAVKLIYNYHNIKEN